MPGDKPTSLAKLGADVSLRGSQGMGLDEAATEAAGEAKYKKRFILNPLRLWEKHKYEKLVEENRNRIVMDMSNEDLVEAFLRRELDHRGDTNIAWQTIGLRVSGEMKFDFGAMILPCLFTLEVSGKISGASCKQTLMLVRAVRTPVRSGTLGQIWSKLPVRRALGKDFSLDDHLMLACMQGHRFEFEAGCGVETGFKLSTPLDGITAAATGYAVEVKATVGASVKGKYESYRVCDQMPFFVNRRKDLQDKYVFCLRHDKSKEYKSAYEFDDGGMFRSKQKQPFNQLCSVTYFQRKAAGGLSIQAEASLSDGGWDPKYSAGASAGIEGSYSTAGFRIQTSDDYGQGNDRLVHTQDTTVLYKRLAANWGINATKYDTEDKTLYEKGGEKAWVDSMSYKSCVSFWLLEYQSGLDKYDKNANTRGKNLAYYNALFPESVLPGSGMQLGESIPSGLLFSMWRNKRDILNADRDSDAGIKKMVSVLANMANALRVEYVRLRDFILGLDFYLESIDWDNTGNQFLIPHTTAFLIEANFEAPMAKHVHDGDFQKARLSTSTDHHLGEHWTQKNRRGRFRGIKDLTKVYMRDLDAQGSPSRNHRHDLLLGEDIGKKKPVRLWDNYLQSMRLRFRAGDQRDNTKTVFKLGFKLGGVIDARLTIDKIDRVGFEGIIDLANEWFSVGYEEAGPVGHEFRVPPATLMY